MIQAIKRPLRHVPGLVPAWRWWLGRRPPSTAEPGLDTDVDVRLDGVAAFRMRHRHGRDQIARDVRLLGAAAYERPFPEVFARCVAECHGLVIDVGANTGFYSLLAVCAAADVRVHAFEPLPAVADALGENLRINERGRHVTVFREAVSDVTGVASLYVPDPSHGLVETSASLDPEFKERIDSSLSVSLTTLDEHASRHGCRPAVIKVDVESQEHRVLRGAERLLAEHRPVVFYELLPKGDAAAIAELAARHGYVDVRLRPDEAIVGAPPAFDEAAWNHALLPREAAERWLEAIGRAVPVRRAA